MDVNIGMYMDAVKAEMTNLDQSDIVRRIWQKDYTVWKHDPTEITNRLGWLTVIDLMRDEISTLESFAEEVRSTGFRHVVLLGMGGSSLGPEVLQQTLSSTVGYPKLIVLDSTIPARVQEVAETVDLEHTLFLVSSKSGTTIEPLSLYQYFRHLLTTTTKKENVGQHFLAITDPGTPLAKQAEQEGFRRVFPNPADIGGRYAVLSYFGLVPAALISGDIRSLLDRADCMRGSCATAESVQENPGALLGAVIGTLALRGRDKLTLVTSPVISSLGLWVEQLIAESTGKEGKGIIPVVGEPLLEPLCYGDDRLFVYLRVQNDDNSSPDRAIERIRSSGQPIVVIEMQDSYDLGAEFFRWEFATAIAGAILGVNPFDQPDVQAAKQATEGVLGDFMTLGHLSQVEAASSLTDLLANADSKNYVAVLAYLRETAEIDKLMASLRRKIAERYHIATTLGYGPRYLHSTGQLHKGGPKIGLLLLITSDHKKDLPIPGKKYTLGILADAQALGDLLALQSSGRRVARIHLSQGDAGVISRLVSELN